MTDRRERNIQMQFLYIFIVSPFELLMLPVVICQENKSRYIYYSVVLLYVCKLFALHNAYISSKNKKKEKYKIVFLIFL